MSKFQAVGFMVELEAGLSKAQIASMLEKLPDDEELIAFDVSENNSTIWGYMTIDVADDERLHAQILTQAKKLCEDFDHERTDKMYPIAENVSLYVDCDFETARGELEQRVFSSQGALVNVETTDTVYENYIVCPKPYTPAIHLLEAVNGDVVEVKTADILSISDPLPF